MADLHSIKLRIRGISETRKVTRAMKLISAAKLKKARQQLDASLPYFNMVKSTMADILLHSAGVESLYFGSGEGVSHRSPGRDVYVILSGDKGLAGGYNSNVFKFAETRLSGGRSPLLLAAGRTGFNYFSGKGYDVAHDFICPIDNPDTRRAGRISETILRMFRDPGPNGIYLIYTRMVSAIRLEPQIMKLLPLQMESLLADLGASRAETDALLKAKPDEDMVFEPGPGAVLDVHIPMYLTGVIFGALVEAFTSEQCARMTAMDNATSNADEMLQNLNLQYNRARQAAITQEISEIVGGAG